MMVRYILFMMLLLVIAKPAYADGWWFANGRFPEGPVIVLTLTKQQKAFVDLVLRCRNHKTNVRTPYIFRLTPAQSEVLKKKVGFSPKRFVIFESYKGRETGVDEDVNINNRFSENEFEIPDKLLTRDAEARDWEVNIMGWLPNPLENMNQKDIKPDTKCP